MVQAVTRPLLKTNNSSSPGPDSISYRQLKQIKDTVLGQAILNDIATSIWHKGRLCRDLNMVMVSKPGKDTPPLEDGDR